MSNDCGFWLRVNGAWVPLEGIQAGVSRRRNRATSEFESMGGVLHIQQAPSAPREWSWDFTNATPDSIKWLATAANGGGGQVWLLDGSAARANMFTPLFTKGPQGQPVIAVDDAMLPTHKSGATSTRICLNNLTHVISGWTTQTTGASILTYKAGVAAAVTVNAPAGTGSRRFSASFTPAGNQEVVFTITTADKTTGLRLTQGAPDNSSFVEGENTPCRVWVADPEQTLNSLHPGKHGRSDYSVTLKEVG